MFWNDGCLRRSPSRGSCDGGYNTCAPAGTARACTVAGLHAHEAQEDDYVRFKGTSRQFIATERDSCGPSIQITN